MDSEYLSFLRTDGGERKTETWDVRSRRHGDLLGRIKWYGAWRQYCFWPQGETVFNRGCLDDINAFMSSLMDARRSAPSSR